MSLLQIKELASCETPSTLTVLPVAIQTKIIQIIETPK